MTAYLTSVAFVVLAEMGDKTQLLAMAFASRYRWQTVMSGASTNRFSRFEGAPRSQDG